jgi:hypothetical protein
MIANACPHAVHDIHCTSCLEFQVKAWCYYESRLLGAHHGLISTYALETLVLYVFNKHHASLHRPLEVCHVCSHVHMRRE